MSLDELMQHLHGLIEAHPEAQDAQVWATDRKGKKAIHVQYVGYDRRHKPARVKLED